MEACLVFPVSGILNGSRRSTGKFLYWILTTFFTIALLLFSSMEAVFFIFDWISIGGINRGFVLTFHLVGLLFGFKLFCIARKWPQTAQRWSNQEALFLSARYMNIQSRNSPSLTKVTTFSLVVGIACSMTYAISNYDQARIHQEVCKFPTNYSTFAYMYIWSRPHLFKYVGFEIWMAPLLELQYFVLTLYWMLGHNFVMICSVWLTARLKQLLDWIRYEAGHGYNSNWNEIYEHFDKLVLLVEDVDEVNGFFVLMIYPARLAFFCYFIFKLIRFV